MLLAGVTAGPVLGLAAGCGQAAGAPGPGGGQVAYSVRYDGPALVSADGRTITVGGFSAPCFGTVRPVAVETAQRVEVWLRYVASRRHGVCNKDLAIILAREVRLPAPVGHRELVSGASGHPLPVFGAQNALRPAVPPGYKLQYVSPVVSGFAPGSPAQAGCTQFYLSSTAVLTIVQAQRRLVLPLASGQRAVAIEVRGHRGQATVNAITWREHGRYVLITVSPNGPPRPVMSTRQLIALADSAD